MTKLFITTLALVFAFAGAANAATKKVTTTTTTTTTAAAPVKMHHRLHHRHHANAAPVEQRSDTTPYTEMRVGDPRIVYHEIGTSGTQKGNTIVPFHDEPIRSSKPYEIRYDYAEFRDNGNR